MLHLYHADPVANSMKSNPNGQVPVLVHDGAVITESTVITAAINKSRP